MAKAFALRLNDVRAFKEEEKTNGREEERQNKYPSALKERKREIWRLSPFGG